MKKTIALMFLAAVMTAQQSLDDSWKVFCPVCVEKDLKSTVRSGMSTRTLMGWGQYYDEKGVFRSDNPNISTTEWYCSHGHEWTEECQHGKCETTVIVSADTTIVSADTISSEAVRHYPDEGPPILIKPDCSVKVNRNHGIEQMFAELVRLLSTGKPLCGQKENPQ